MKILEAEPDSNFEETDLETCPCFTLKLKQLWLSHYKSAVNTVC